MENIKTAIYNQWQSMLDYGNIPCFEIELNNGDYLVVDINYTEGDEYISFTFEDSLPVFFDGGIKKHGGGYRILLDECFSSLNSYLETIYNNILEGYILPNNLLLCDDE